MTTPAQPATGAGEPGTGQTSGTDPAANGQQPATGGQNDATDWASLFEGMTPEEVQTKLKHARTWESRAKENAKALEEARKAGQPKDGELTAEQLQQQLAEATEAREQAEEKVARLAFRSTVRDVASEVGADASALLDSMDFLDQVADELGEDYDDDELARVIKKLGAQFVKKGPRFRSTTGPAAGGADLSGGGAPAPNAAAQIEDAQKKGDFRTAIALKRRLRGGQ